MLSRRVLAVVLLIAIVAIVSVQGRRHHALRVPGKHTLPTKSTPHPEETADEATLALWAKRHEELKARNYQRPTKAQLLELGFEESQLGSGTYGVDASAWIGESTWSCMKGKGYDFGIVREFMESCAIDSNGVHSVANGWAAGMAHMDVYLFPSYGCSVSAAAQVDAVISTMGGIPFGTIWIDIEAGGQGSASNNHAWMMEALNHGTSRIGASRMGIYSSQYEWGQVMGGLSGPTNYPLWFADYDGSPSFAGFRAFGGWTNPNMKQFAGDASMCSADVDLNWY